MKVINFRTDVAKVVSSLKRIACYKGVLEGDDLVVSGHSPDKRIEKGDYLHEIPFLNLVHSGFRVKKIAYREHVSEPRLLHWTAECVRDNKVILEEAMREVEV